MMAPARNGPIKNNIKLPQDLRPILYSAFNKRATSILLKKPDSPRVQTAVVPMDASPVKKAYKVAGPMDASKTGIERRALITEIGGFHNKNVLKAYYTRKQQMEALRKHQPLSQAAPNEEFLKKQKNKLRDLMLMNSAIENRRSLKMAMK